MRPRTAVAAIVVVAAVAAGAARAEIVDRLDQKAGELACTRWWNDKGPKLAKLTGRVVVLHFHDPGKITSQAFEEKVKALATRNADKPFTLIEVLVDCDEAAAESYVARSGATWPVGLDAKDAAALAYPGSSVPRTYVIGPDGVVAWHAHLGALTPAILDAQFARARLYDEETLPRGARVAAKAARELRFGPAAREAQRLLDATQASAEEKQVATTILEEIRRYHAFQAGIVEALEKDLDWALAERRVARMREIYRGTEFEEAVEAEWKKLEANPRVAWIAAGEAQVEKVAAKTNVRKKNDLESAITELRNVLEVYEGTKPGERAERWIAEYERRLRELGTKR